MEITEEQKERFWSKVNKTDDCWVWTACKTNGYGRFDLNGRLLNAHRVSLMINGVKIPHDLVVDHMCRNRYCVRPDHLRVVTRVVNCLENSVGISAMNAKKTHCKNGHEFTKSNTYPHRSADGRIGRQCRTCNIADNTRRYKLKRLDVTRSKPAK